MQLLDNFEELPSRWDVRSEDCMTRYVTGTDCGHAKNVYGEMVAPSV